MKTLIDDYDSYFDGDKKEEKRKKKKNEKKKKGKKKQKTISRNTK